MCTRKERQKKTGSVKEEERGEEKETKKGDSVLEEEKGEERETEKDRECAGGSGISISIPF